MDRPLTDRERAVLDALVAVDFPGAHAIREQAASVRVVGVCGCGCPSIEFLREDGDGLTELVDAHIEGTYDALMLHATYGDRLAGIEYISNSDTMASEMPDPSTLKIRPA